ncbi:type IV pilus biogenesis protein PilM [Bacillus pinisoli]|uniref:type IV pilus biogenesis protein PilM n=1 Tax=Bacillus pinisoli TaxID=2901866 RepID=UPI001FF6B23B|nr:pilus assembly protein PilM [Bacillus pinisoli]
MVFSIMPRGHKPINIIIKDHVIRFVELKTVSPISVLKKGERYLPDGLIKEGRIIDQETLLMILEECIQDWGIKKRKIRFVVPDSFVVIRKVDVPTDLADEEIHGYLQFELGSSIHLPFEDPILDFEVVEVSEEKKSVLLFASPEEVIQEYVEMFQELRLKAIAADISPLSLYRLYYIMDQAATDERLLLVQYDQKSVNFSIFEEYKPIFMRHLVLDNPSKLWRVEEGKYTYLGDPVELKSQMNDTYKEIERILSFYRFSLNQGRKQVTKIVVTGDHPKIREITGDLQERVEVPIAPLVMSRALREHDLTDGFQLAVGLALKEV